MLFRSNFQSPYHLRAHDEVIVRFVLSDVANADEFGMMLKFEQLSFALGAGEIDPTDDARDEFAAFRQAENPSIFRDVMLGLDKNRSLNAAGAEQRLKMFRQIVAIDLRELGVVEPGVVKRLTALPEMLVSVDDVHSGR